MIDLSRGQNAFIDPSFDDRISSFPNFLFQFQLIAIYFPFMIGMDSENESHWDLSIFRFRVRRGFGQGRNEKGFFNVYWNLKDSSAKYLLIFCCKSLSTLFPMIFKPWGVTCYRRNDQVWPSLVPEKREGVWWALWREGFLRL